MDPLAYNNRAKYMAPDKSFSLMYVKPLETFTGLIMNAKYGKVHPHEKERLSEMNDWRYAVEIEKMREFRNTESSKK